MSTTDEATTGPVGECDYVDADECAMARERSVAGTDDAIPPCPVHGDCLHGGYHAHGTCPEAKAAAEAVTA